MNMDCRRLVVFCLVSLAVVIVGGCKLCSSIFGPMLDDGMRRVPESQLQASTTPRQSVPQSELVDVAVPESSFTSATLATCLAIVPLPSDEAVPSPSHEMEHSPQVEPASALTVLPVDSANSAERVTELTSPQNSEPQPSIQIHITNVRVGQGPVRAALFTDPTRFPSVDSAAAVTSAAAAEDQVSLSMALTTKLISQVAEQGGGRVALAVYQDINSDGQLNRNRMGIPTEPFAFSGDVRVRRRAPTFQEAAIELGNAGSLQNSVVSISLPTAASL